MARGHNGPMKDILKRAGGNIRRVRKAKGLTLEDAAGTDLNATYLGRVERGEENISLKNLAKVARALQVDPYELLLPSGADPQPEELIALIKATDPGTQALILDFVKRIPAWREDILASTGKQKSPRGRRLRR